MGVFDNYSNLKLKIIKGDLVSEEDVRQSFNEDIKNYLKDKFDMNIEFRNEVKTTSRTFIDSKWENFIIEYKKPTVRIGKNARKQLINYLNGLDKYSYGIINNGKKIELYSYSNSENKFVIDDKISGDINEEQLKYICSLIANKDNFVLTENNINEYLGIEKNREIIRTIYEKLVNSTSTRTKLLYDEWQKLFNISDEHDLLDSEKNRNIIKFYEELLDKKIDTVTKIHKALFSIQTYYSIILKLVLYKIILNKTGEKITKPKFYRDFFRSIESNKLYRKYNILNLIDGDFFSWYVDELGDKEFSYLYDKISDVAVVETYNINMLFIKFYENIFPFWVRHAMGEYYTPLYLAKEVVDKTCDISGKSKDKIRLLDPTCGSGIFILYASSLGIENIYGIDINPLAVLTSKINYLINNFDLSEPLEIPIYLGDSTYFPTLTEINGIKCYKYELSTSISTLDTISFVFSEDSLKEKHFFEILDDIEVFIKLKDKSKAIEVIKSYPSFKYESIGEYYDKLIDELIYLEERGLNSIWLKIIGNYLKSGSIRNIDCVVGNPPWVRWANLPDMYKKLIKKNCRIDGIFSKDRNSGGVDLNICALITFVTMRERVKDSGVLGFIMPDSILFNKSFEGFRNMEINEDKKYYLNSVVRWNDKNEKPFDPVSLDFAEYYFTYKKPSMIDVYDRKDKRHKIAFRNEESFNNHFIICDKSEYKSIKSVLGSNKLEFHSGISLVKGGYYLLEFAKKIDDNISSFYHYERQGNKIVRSNETIELETDIVYPYIKSDLIEDNTIEDTKYYCIYPYPYGSKEPYSFKEIREKYPLFYKYFMSEGVQLAINTASSYNKRIQKTNFDVGIFRVGKYTYSDCFLATRDNTKSVFAIVKKLQTPWGEEKMPIFDGHINYISMDEDGNKLTTKKAQKLFKKFTRRGVKLYIKCSSDSRSISSRLYNDIDIN